MNTPGEKPTNTGWKQNKPILIFLGLFILQIVVFYCIYLSPFFQNTLVTPVAILYAKLSGILLNLFGQQAIVTGDMISSLQFSISIKKGCDAMEPMALLVAGVISFPAPYRKKINGLLIGLTIIFLLNIIRIVTLFLTGIYKRALFDAMHVEIWQVIFILVAVSLWFIWLFLVVKKKGVS